VFRLALVPLFLASVFFGVVPSGPTACTVLVKGMNGMPMMFQCSELPDAPCEGCTGTGHCEHITVPMGAFTVFRCECQTAAGAAIGPACQAQLTTDVMTGNTTITCFDRCCDNLNPCPTPPLGKNYPTLQPACKC